MVLSTENGALRTRIGEQRAIEMLARAGFDAIDYGFSPWLERGEMVWNTPDYRSYAKEVSMMARDNGVFFNQAHGPFLFDSAHFPNYEQEVLPLYRRCFEVCALLNVPHVVVHPIHHLPYRGNEALLWEMNLDYYRKLLPHAREFGVKIALENMYQYDPRRGVLTRDVFAIPEEYARFYDSLDADEFICCVDTGHCGIVGEDAGRVLRAMGRRVKALHVNDNFFRTDDHVVPGHGLMDWNDVTKALADIGYDGDITFEVLNIYRSYDEGFLSVSAKHLHDVGRYLISKIEEYRGNGGRA